MRIEQRNEAYVLAPWHCLFCAVLSKWRQQNYKAAASLTMATQLCNGSDTNPIQLARRRTSGPGIFDITTRYRYSKNGARVMFTVY